MVAINDFCWSAFLTKSALFLKLAPHREKHSGALGRDTSHFGIPLEVNRNLGSSVNSKSKNSRQRGRLVKAPYL